MDKGSAVRDLFDRIAGRYDLANTAMTGGLDALWRRRAAAQIDVPSDARLVDLCCGTGALTRILAKKVPDGEAIGIDFSANMLDVARAATGCPNIRYLQGDVLSLPFNDAYVDGATMGYSMRNIVDIGACLREIKRVLKPGASFVNLEISKPSNPLWRKTFFFYFYRVLPSIGGFVGRDKAAYRYLPQSLVNSPDASELAQLFKESGFAHVRCLQLMGGAITIHVGTTAQAPRHPHTIEAHVLALEEEAPTPV
jgi:demethylmenaquinone methyltransferase/2-methoxy-6-polyprenyl-1,4-benzoquinol methylase